MQNSYNNFSSNDQQNGSPVFYSKLSGLPVLDASSSVPAVVAIMLDNHFEARPQFGLSEAVVVYEAPVEGSFTRFLTIFERDKVVDKIGPVRSARSYFLDWQQEYGNPLYMHCGGSPEALDRIKKENIFAANEFYWGKYYWRDNNFKNPYNLFTNSGNWENLLIENDKNNFGDKNWSGWIFNSEITTGTSASSFIVDYGAGYKVEWKFNSAINRYSRYLQNKQQFDANGEELLFDNIIVQYVNVAVIDEVGRKKIDTVGTGSVRIFRDGSIISGYWKKDSISERTRFFTENNEEISLKPGNTWVQVVPVNGSLTITN